MAHRHYRFFPKRLEFRRLPSWAHPQRWTVPLLLLIGALGGVALFAYLILEVMPSPSLHQLHQREIDLERRHYAISLLHDSLKLKLQQAESLEKAIYATLVPPADSAYSVPSTPPLPEIPLSEETLSYYLTRLETHLRYLIRNEELLQTPELRSLCLPRRAPCACEGIAAGMGTLLHPVLSTPYPHQGVDFLASEGSLVWATAEGIVTQIEITGRGEPAKVYIQHMPHLLTAYYPVHPTVQVGQWVAQGTSIGRVARIPLAKVSFLHYEVWLRGEATDPLLYLWGSFPIEERQRIKSSFQRPVHGVH
ncbi:MAG: M23 family metallopeptidase [Bacteroidia bacterium]|nr:M23 family metallopeptidase [Bacteroidia bacterium]MDW8235435.1 M23 family metallopeptidase [Bacteroidia bacterium]